MTAQVLAGYFTHEHNRRKVVRQEYELAKQHFKEVCLYRNATNPDHNQRFLDAATRRDAARERLVELLTS